MKKYVKVGKYTIRLWLVAILIIGILGSTGLAYHLITNLTIPTEIEEPILVLNYPSQMNLYPGDTKEFSVTVKNEATNDYSVVLDLKLDNTIYQNNYVSFSNKVYTVTPGEQDLNAWMKVDSDAPPANVSLMVEVIREVYPDGLVGFWRFDEGKGTAAIDSTMQGNDGILVNGPIWTDGKYSRALSFDGIDDYVMVPDSQSLRLQRFTLCAWIYMDTRPYAHSGNNHVAMVNKMHWLGGSYPTGTAYGYKLDFEYPNSGDDDLVITIGDGTAQRFPVKYNSINDLTLNTWHFVVGTFDGKMFKIYIDGNLKATSEEVDYSIENNDTPLGIGYEVRAAGDGHFKGKIDNVMVYNRAITADEVLDLYQIQP